MKCLQAERNVFLYGALSSCNCCVYVLGVWASARAGIRVLVAARGRVGLPKKQNY